jgi:hypothetical protein
VRRVVVAAGVAVGLLAVGVTVTSIVGSGEASSDDAAVVDESGDAAAAIAVATQPADPASGDAASDDAASGDVTSGSVAGVGPSPGEPGVATDVEATEPTGPPSVENPASVYIVGDSDAGTFGPYLEQLLDGTRIVETDLNYKVSSGLARPDFFDWPAELARTLPEVDPDIVVATFGGNDAQGLAVADGSFIIDDPVSDEAEWTAEYRRRVGEVMDLMLADGRTLVWVGIPNDDSAEVTERLRIQDQAVRAEAASRPEVVFIDTWTRFSGRSGGWAEYVIDPRDGQGKDVRADDGFHLNENGAEILAIDIAQAIRDDLRARGAAI